MDQPIVYIEGLGNIIIPEKQTKEETIKIAHLILDSQLPREVLDIQPKKKKYNIY